MKINLKYCPVNSLFFTKGLLKCYFIGVHIYISIYVIKVEGGDVS